MRSKWWDSNFISSYDTFCKTFRMIALMSFSTRVIVTLFGSFEAAFGGPEIFKFFIILIIATTAHFCRNRSTNTKKIIMYAVIEFLNINLRISSLQANKSMAILFCLESTLLTLLLQSNIFQNLNINIFIAFKHMVLWYVINDQLTFPTDVSSFMISVVSILIWTLFESDKRSLLLSSFQSKKTERKTMKELSNLLQIFPQGLLILTQSFEVQYQNDIFQAILKGEKIKDFLARTCLESSHTTLLEKISETTSDSVSSVFLGLTSINNTKLEWSAKLICWKNGTSYMLTVKDVTTLLQLERASTENKTKNEIIRSISHELRTPINGISLIIDDIINEASDTAKQKLGQIKTCTRLLEFQINDILDYSYICSKKFVLQKTIFDISLALESCLELIKLQADYKNVKLEYKFDAQLPKEIFSDKLRLQKIVTNLLTNAIKFTSKGSIQLVVKRAKDGLKVSVKDSGVGISSEKLSGVLHMFSDESSARTSGMGLFICKKILKFFNSHFKVTSKEGQGSTFSFVLKMIYQSNSLINEICSESSESLPFVHYHKEPAGGNYPKLMIVDDNEFNRMCLATAMRRKGILLLEADNGLKAVQMVQQADKDEKWVKCIIMDCNMPVMDGWEASKRIQQMHKEGTIRQMPAIFAHSAYSSSEDIQMCYDSGMIEYIMKPSTVDEIIARISKYFL